MRRLFSRSTVRPRSNSKPVRVIWVMNPLYTERRLDEGSKIDHALNRGNGRQAIANSVIPGLGRTCQEPVGSKNSAEH